MHVFYYIIGYVIVFVAGMVAGVHSQRKVVAAIMATETDAKVIGHKIATHFGIIRGW